MHRPIDTPVGEKPGWRSFVTEDGRKSLSEVNATISIPPTGSWLRRLLANSGSAPGFSDNPAHLLKFHNLQLQLIRN